MTRGGVVTIIVERFFYFLRRGIKSAASHKLMSAASVGIVAASLVLLGMFVTVGVNLSSILEKLGDSREINVYLARNAAGRSISDIESELKLIDGVHSVKFFSREDRLEKVAREVYGEDGYSFGNGENPLRDSYILTIFDVSAAQRICDAAENVEGVEETVKSSDILGGIDAVVSGARNIGIWLMLIMLLISVFIIANAVRLGIASHGDEIGIMRTIGATDGFIVAPFLFQATFLGMVGAAAAGIICVGGYCLTANRFAVSLPQGIISLVGAGRVAAIVLPLLFGVGIVIGALGSLTAVRKYL